MNFKAIFHNYSPLFILIASVFIGENNTSLSNSFYLTKKDVAVTELTFLFPFYVLDNSSIHCLKISKATLGIH